jgi:mono/diheme cytochrome c family protein
MKLLLKVLKWTGIIILLLVAGLFITGATLYNKKYEAPMPEIHASTDSSVIAHGKHLIYSTAHCIECHYKPGDSIKVVNGEDVDLAGGGFPFTFPGGTFYSRNISSDPETGIGKMTDQEIARTLRHAVKADGSVLIPVMEYQNLSDEDITAIISYLRTTQPVKYEVPENDYNLLGYAILAYFIRPEGPKETPPARVIPDTTVEYGNYIAGSLANCKGCHTIRDRNTGAYVGEELAGGPLEPVSGDPTRILVTPNLTPDPETGKIYNWTFEQFKNRFSQGKLIPQSIMPWGQFKHLNDTELLAIWKYLRSVKPVKQDNGPAIQDAKKI